MASGWLKDLFDIRRGERALAGLMFVYFFLVITSFWILKPIKKSIFIRYYDQTGFDLFSWHLNAAQVELLAKVLNMGVAFAAVVSALISTVSSAEWLGVTFGLGLLIVAIVGLYEMVSTLLDFQFTSTVSHYLDGAAIGEQFSRVFAITNGVSLLVQLLLTSFVMRKFGLTVALVILPLAVLSASTAYMMLPGLWLGSPLNTADNGFSYSINQSAKEALYVPTTRDEKYKAKAFIDMFVQRFAKALAVGLSLGITTLFADFSSVRWLSGLTLPLVAVWILAVRHAGRRFAETTAGVGSDGSV